MGLILLMAAVGLTVAIRLWSNSSKELRATNEAYRDKMEWRGTILLDLMVEFGWPIQGAVMAEDTTDTLITVETAHGKAVFQYADTLNFLFRGVYVNGMQLPVLVSDPYRANVTYDEFITALSKHSSP